MPDNNQNQIPGNLPTGDFSPAPKVNEPVDILSDIDQSSIEVKGPETASVSKAGQTFRPSNVPPAMTPPPRPVAKEPVFGQGKKVVAGIVALVLVGTLATVGWYVYSNFLAAPTPAPVNQTVNQNEDQQPTIGTSPSADEVPTPVALDTDKDGLSDQEEELYGTDPTRIDSDLDGLTDRDEVLTFKTDPNNPDTDGDSFLDGAEVRSGYDPNGPGRLLEIN